MIEINIKIIIKVNKAQDIWLLLNDLLHEI